MFLSKIVATKEAAVKLQGLGIFHTTSNPMINPALWHVRHFGDDTWRIKEDGSFCLHDPCTYYPAWTKAELDVMIGPNINKPDLPNNIDLHRGDNPDLFITYYPERTLMASGAECSAYVLRCALEAEKVNPLEAIARYNKQFGV